MVHVRQATPDDAPEVAALTGELGYPAEVHAIRHRLSRLCVVAEHAVLVACEGARVVGWLHASVVEHVQAEPRAEIGGLVVADARGRRTGAALVAAAEAWAKGLGLATILVRSQIVRDDAHRFYLREGYARTKTSAVFTKQLLDGSSISTISA